MPAFDLEPARPLRLLARDAPDRLAECPQMALGIERAIGPVAIELIRRLLQDHRAGRARPRAVRVDAVLEVGVNRLRVLAPDNGRAGDRVAPLRADIDHAVAETHLRMPEIAVLVGDDQAALEPERLGQPLERCPRVLVVEAGCQSRACERVTHDFLLHDLRNISPDSELYITQVPMLQGGTSAP